MLIKRLYLFLLLAIVIIKGNAQSNLSYPEIKQAIQEIESPVELKIRESKVLVSTFQSQVITSSTGSDYSYGWLDIERIKYNKENKTTHFYGGEDRFWLNPLGSKYSLYYGDKEIKQSNWSVPDLFTKQVFTLNKKSKTEVHFSKKNASIINNIGTTFKVDVHRKIKIYSKEQVKDFFRIKKLGHIKVVGFGSTTTITNISDNWNNKHGLIAPWTLGMFKGSTNSVGIFPFVKKDSESKVSTYFLKERESRLQITKKAAYFKTDGEERSKMGLKKEYCRPVIGNYDFKNKRLTIIDFSFTEKGAFLSSDEKHLENMFDGDVVNSYNNSKNKKGDPTFFELETTTPAVALKKGESNTHVHRTFHFEGEESQLNKLSKQILGIDLNKVKKVFNGN